MSSQPVRPTHVRSLTRSDVVAIMRRLDTGEQVNPEEREAAVRHGLPDGAVLAPGVISRATDVVEHPQLVVQQLERLTRVVGTERVIASTDCGFAQDHYIRSVHPSVEWAKLEALAEGAKIASQNLGLAG